MALGCSSPRMSFRSLFARLLRCSVHAGTSQPIPAGQVHSTKPARRSSFGSATWLSALCSSCSVQPTWLRPLGSAHSAQPTRLSPLGSAHTISSSGAALCPALGRPVLRSTAPLLEALGCPVRASLARGRVGARLAPPGARPFRRSGAQVFGHFALVLRLSVALILSGFGPRSFGSSAALRFLLCMLLCMLLYFRFL